MAKQKTMWMVLRYDIEEECTWFTDIKTRKQYAIRETLKQLEIPLSEAEIGKAPKEDIPFAVSDVIIYGRREGEWAFDVYLVEVMHYRANQLLDKHLWQVRELYEKTGKEKISRCELMDFKEQDNNDSPVSE